MEIADEDLQIVNLDDTSKKAQRDKNKPTLAFVDKMIIHNRLRFMNLQRLKLLKKQCTGEQARMDRMPIIPTLIRGEGEFNLCDMDHEAYIKSKRLYKTAKMNDSSVASLVLNNHFKSPLDDSKKIEILKLSDA